MDSERTFASKVYALAEQIVIALLRIPIVTLTCDFYYFAPIYMSLFSNENKNTNDEVIDNNSTYTAGLLTFDLNGLTLCFSLLFSIGWFGFKVFMYYIGQFVWFIDAKQLLYVIQYLIIFVLIHTANQLSGRFICEEQEFVRMIEIPIINRYVAALSLQCAIAGCLMKLLSLTSFLQFVSLLSYCLPVVLRLLWTPARFLYIAHNLVTLYLVAFILALFAQRVLQYIANSLNRLATMTESGYKNAVQQFVENLLNQSSRGPFEHKFYLLCVITFNVYSTYSILDTSAGYTVLAADILAKSAVTITLVKALQLTLSTIRLSLLSQVLKTFNLQPEIERLDRPLLTFIANVDNISTLLINSMLAFQLFGLSVNERSDLIAKLVIISLLNFVQRCTALIEPLLMRRDEWNNRTKVTVDLKLILFALTLGCGPIFYSYYTFHHFNDAGTWHYMITASCLTASIQVACYLLSYIFVFTPRDKFFEITNQALGLLAVLPLIGITIEMPIIWYCSGLSLSLRNAAIFAAWLCAHIPAMKQVYFVFHWYAKWRQANRLVKQLPRATKNQLVKVNDVCAVCSEALDSTACILPCNHIFHELCLKSWFSTRFECPMCREALVQSYAGMLTDS